MKVFIICLLVLLASLLTNCSLFTEPYDPDRAPPDYCYGKTYNVGFMKRGEIKHLIIECTEVYCRGDGDVRYESCSPFDVQPPCYGTGDPNKPYPECCNYTVQCPPGVLH